MRTSVWKTAVLITLFAFRTDAVQARSVAVATMIFLQLPPSPQANGRSGVYLPSGHSDPYGPISNPGVIGLMARDNVLTWGFYATKTDWLPSFHIPDLTYSSYAVNFGLSQELVSKWAGRQIPISLGVGFNEIYINMGESPWTDDLGNYLGSFRTWERCNGISFGMGVDFVLRAGIGMTNKTADSHLVDSGVAGPPSAKAKADLEDWGYVVELPLVEAVSRVSGKRLLEKDGLRAELTPAFAYAKQNIGGKVRYTRSSQADPVPRTAVAEVSIGVQLTYTAAALGTWQVLSVEAGTRGESDLFYRDDNRVSHYSSGNLGDINIWNDLVRGKTNRDLFNMKGWEVNLFESLAFRGGRFEDHVGKIFNNSEGFSLRTAGLFKYIKHTTPHLSPAMMFIADHLDLQYHFSKFYGDEDEDTWAGTRYEQVSVLFKL
jgi:hypothetical protein